RQQMVKPPGRPNLALSDFTAPRESGVTDHVGAFAVTAGHGLDELVARFEADHDDYSAILAKALADRLAEAFAERLHELVRREFWAYSPDEHLPNDAIIREEYQGIRPAPGYPACPDHTEKGTLFALLEAENRAGIRLTESFAMWPGAAVSGYYFWHPQAHYFGLGRIGPDQLADYAERKGVDVEAMARWLAPNLADASGRSGGGCGRFLLHRRDHPARQDAVRLDPRLAALGREGVAQPDRERVEERLTDGPEHLGRHAVAGMARAERLDGRNDRVELVDALHDDRERLHQVLALGGHVGVGEQPLERRVERLFAHT